MGLWEKIFVPSAQTSPPVIVVSASFSSFFRAPLVVCHAVSFREQNPSLLVCSFVRSVGRRDPDGNDGISGRDCPQ